MATSNYVKRLSNQVIENQTIMVAAKGEESFGALGPNLELRRCTLVFDISTRALTLSNPRFCECEIKIKRPLRNCRWYEAYVEGCTFSGKMIGNDFGTWSDDPDADGALVRCDFQRATLDACRFINVDTSTTLFPPWPCFTVLRPAERCQEFRKISWPGKLSVFAELYCDVPSEVTAITESAPELISRYGSDLGTLHRLLSAIPDVLLLAPHEA